MHTRNGISLAMTAAVSLSMSPIASTADLTLTADLPTGQPAGTTVEWTVSGDGIEALDSRLSVLRSGTDGELAQANGTIMYDYGRRSTFEWTPLMPGSYVITAEVRDSDGNVTTLSKPFRIAFVPGSARAPVISTTRNPLVALYSAPACTPGRFMRVLFQGSFPGARLYRTDAKPCVAGQTMNLYVAGMRAQTTYSIRHEIENDTGQVVRFGPLGTFTTGAIDISVPTPNILIPAGPDTSIDESILLSAPVGGQGFDPAAIDLDGQLVWYYKPSGGADSSFRVLTRWNDGGTFFGVTLRSDQSDRLAVREVDLAGNTVRETNSRRIGEMLQEQGQQRIGFVHHEVLRLPDGRVALLGTVERLLEDVQGPGLVDVLGDMVIVLDENMQLVWSVNLFDVLQVTRRATGRETCIDGSIDCPYLLLADTANDWTHAVSISHSPSDGNLIVSLRHQDWMIKLDYRDGAGTGGLLWRLGKEGDFTPLGFPGDVDRWSTHQHDAERIGTDRLINFDNGNLAEACLADPQDCRSHGQAWLLDTTSMTATLELDADLGDYSSALGAAQVLGNENYSFYSGLPGGLTTPLSRLDEVRPDGTKVFSVEFNARGYRGFRLKDLYTAPSYD